MRIAKKPLGIYAGRKSLGNKNRIISPYHRTLSFLACRHYVEKMKSPATFS